MALTRRAFLGSTAAVAALGTRDTLWGRVAFALDEKALGPAPDRALVVIQLAGGNDGLNTVVPYADPAYRKLRPSISLAESELVNLNDKVAFHNALAPLLPRFNDQTLAIVQGVGYPKPDRSHFVSTAIWQTAKVTDPYREPTGWLGRSLDTPPSGRPVVERAPHRSLEALGIGGGGLTPAMISAHTRVPSLLSLDAFTVQPDRRYPADAPALKVALSDIYAGPEDPTSVGFIQGVGRTALESSDALRGAVTRYTSMVEYPRGVLGDQLKLIAQLLTANVGTRLFHLTLGGFDTHANQKQQQRNLLAQIGEGVNAFLGDLKSHGIDDRVAVMTYSEFGRRAAENGSAGTDHGAASVLFLAGTRVAGGLHGPVPDLGRLEGGDVPFAIDFRSVYASVLRDWLGIRPDQVLGAGFDTLPLFRA